MSPGEVAAVIVVASVAFVIVVAFARERARVVIVATMAIATASSVMFRRERADRKPSPDVPRSTTALGYVSSSACRSCHPAEHASFGRTYHRTMTQAASTETVAAPIDGRDLRLDDRVVRLERRGAEVWATLPDPDLAIEHGGNGLAEVPDVTRRIVLTTGSHREQAYWVAGKRSGDLRLVPFVWLVRDRAFVARRDAFLTPPDAPLPPVRWASNCIACHAVAGEPRHDVGRDAFATRVGELGVACEACHGPGAAHVEKHRDPVQRYLARSSNEPDVTIVQPKRLPPERSAAVCGQCHSYAFPRDEDGFWTDGYARSFRAGDALEPSRTLITERTFGAHGSPVVDAPASAIFWSDGAVRVGGREYNGLVSSPCYERGEGDRKVTCLSCHAMHDGDPRGQVDPAKQGDRGCTQCHADVSLTSAGHTHHAQGSVGSACVACHMPKTSYALLSQVRSHRVDSPRIAGLGDAKPNACNLCHLDRSLAWTACRLSEWYGQAPDGACDEGRGPPLASDRSRIAYALAAGIAGDAGVRALIADALGSGEAALAVRRGFEIPILTSMRADPYAAVRFIAERSLRVRGGSNVEQEIDPEQLRALLAVRDLRAITIAE